MSDLLDQRLREIADEMRVDLPESLVTDVLERLGERPARRWRRWLTGLLAGVVGVGVVASPAGAGLREWFGFHGVAVEERQPAVSPSPTVPIESPGRSVTEAASLVGFEVRAPRTLGAPDGTAVSADRRVVSPTWGSGPTAIRVDQFRGSVDPLVWKTARDAVRVDVLGADALWFPSAHQVAMVADDGTDLVLPSRPSAPTLVWTRGEVTLRLEGDLTRSRAIALAESAG